MFKKLFQALILPLVLLSACSEPFAAPPTGPAVITSAPDEPVTSNNTPYPWQPISNDNPSSDAYPAPSPLQPLPHEDNLVRGEVFIDKSEILLLESYPVQVMLSLQGSLPTPCHFLRVKVSEPDEKNRIQVEVYSLSKPDEICIQVLEAFEVNIPLGSYTGGMFSVWVNEEKVGEFDA